MVYDTNSQASTTIQSSTGEDVRAQSGRSRLIEWLRIAPELVVCAEKAYLEQSPEESQQVCPIRSDVFRAFESVAPDAVRVVVLAQDPYHTIGKASGLAFGYRADYKGPIDSSLLNILTEMRRCGYHQSDATLENLAQQGVLLLNSSLSVRTGHPLSHCGLVGWERQVGKILKYLAGNTHCIFLLMGGHSIDLFQHTNGSIGDSGIDYIHTESDRVVITSHPSNLSHTRELRGHRAFTGSGCFDTVNDLLVLGGMSRIQW